MPAKGFRKLLQDLHWDWKRRYSRVKYWLQCRLRSRQDYLLKEIPRSWCDKVELIPRLTFTMFKHFWDESGEDGGSMLQYQFEAEYELQCDERRASFKKVYGDLLEVRRWLDEREKLLEAIDWVKGTDCFRQEEKVFERDIWALQRIAEHHRYLWT